MKFVIQRVTKATVTINPPNISRPSEADVTLPTSHVQTSHVSIGPGLVIFMGIHRDDTPEMNDRWIQKILNLRLFADQDKPINRSLRDTGGEILIISQFTLYGDLKGQNRPSFIKAAKPDVARPVYDDFVKKLKKAWPGTKTGEFAANMQVSLTNDGPVTIILE